MNVKVGIPSALLYFLYFPMWQTFFKELGGVQVITSGKTTKEILDAGVREATADACVPVKLFYGHVLALKDRVDYLFIPRVVCLNCKTVYCPKFLGLPDMIRHSLAGLPPIIDTRMDSRQGYISILKAYCEIGRYFNAGRKTVWKAYWKARHVLKRFNNLMQKGLSLPEAMAGLHKPYQEESRATEPSLLFAVLGYPYAIYDSFISAGLLEKLRHLGVRVITTENFHPRLLARQKNCNLSKRLFWTLSDLALKAAHLVFKQGQVDGVIHLTAFGCGPDSVLNKFIELEAKNHRHIPFMTLTIDEHSGEAGITTRLEAFVDMVRRRKEAVHA